MIKISSHKIVLKKGNVQGLSIRYEYTSPYQNVSNQLDSLKDTNSRFIDYVKSINKKLEPRIVEKSFRKLPKITIKENKKFKSKAETALLLAKSYGLVLQYLQLGSTHGRTVKVDFNPSSCKSAYMYQDLPEEQRQIIKDLLFILEKLNVSESAYRELTVFCDGLPRKYLVSQCREQTR